MFYFREFINAIFESISDILLIKDLGNIPRDRTLFSLRMRQQTYQLRPSTSQEGEWVCEVLETFSEAKLLSCQNGGSEIILHNVEMWTHNTTHLSKPWDIMTLQCLQGFKQIIGKRQTAHTVDSKSFTWHFMPWSGGRDSLQSKMTLPKGPAQKGRMSSSVLWKSDKTSSWWQMPLEAKSAKPTEGDRPSQVSEPKEAGWLTTMWNLEWDSITTTTKNLPGKTTRIFERNVNFS